MKEPVELKDWAGRIQEALPKGVLLVTKAEKTDAMVIGWGALGVCWNKPTFTAYVREGRYTRSQIDATGEFTVSIPLDKADPRITKICGGTSGRDGDKIAAAGLTLEDPEEVSSPGIREYPLTLECKVLYSQKQDLSRIPEQIRTAMYPQDVDGTAPLANRDPHIGYIGQIVRAYIIR